jgi:hypothetical protein
MKCSTCNVVEFETILMSDRNKWLDSNKAYAARGYKRDQTVFDLGMGAGLDWTGTRRKTGRGSYGVFGTAPKFGKNYKPPNLKSLNEMQLKKESCGVLEYQNSSNEQ